jgi:hypothetical protein
LFIREDANSEEKQETERYRVLVASRVAEMSRAYAMMLMSFVDRKRDDDEELFAVCVVPTGQF